MRIFRLHTPYTALLPALLFLLASCTFHRAGHPLLSLADSLLDSCPDSALHLLESLPPDALHDEADRARYALLMTQARDKNYLPHTDDSLIRIAVDYYDRQQETEMQARSYYVWGGVCRDKGEQGRAVECYLTAAFYAKQINNNRLLGRIYSNAGYLYYTQSLYVQTDSLFRLAEQIGRQICDTNLWMESLAMQAKSQFYQNRFAESGKRLSQVQSILQIYPHKLIQADVAATWSLLCCKTGQPERAVHHARLNMELQEDSSSLYRAFLLLGEAYYRREQYDSAYFYLNKSLPSRGYSTKVGAYMRLADIARKEKDIERAFEMERLYSEYQSRLKSASQSTKILMAEHRIREKNQQIGFERRFNAYSRIVGGIVSFSLLCFLVWRYRHLRQIKKYRLEKERGSDKRKKTCLAQDTPVAVMTDFTVSVKEIFDKMGQILNEYKEKGHSPTELTEAEWECLMAYTDPGGNVSTFVARHHLTQREKHLCCLNLLELNATDRARIMHRQTATIYRSEQKIMTKIGEVYETGKLALILKEMVGK